MHNIPDGWSKVEHGCVRIGDQVWAEATQRFIDVTDEVIDQLYFLDAIDVEECICVIRRDVEQPCRS